MGNDDLRLTPEELSDSARKVLGILAYQREHGLQGRGASLSNPPDVDLNGPESDKADDEGTDCSSVK